MTDNITNKDYITITDEKVMVGGKETTKYRGCDIWHMEALPSLFKDIQTKVKQEYGAAPIEMRVLSSKTSRQYTKPGTPSAEPGKNAWVSFVFANGTKTPWVFRYSFSSASDCAALCAYACGLSVRDSSDFRSGVFGPVADKIKALESPAPVSCNKVTQYKADEIRDICVGNQILRVKILSVKNKTL